MKAHRKLICVIGLGQFGSEMARELARHTEVLALDIREEVVNSIVDDVQRALIVDARDFASLRSLITPQFDEVVVSLGESLEASTLCTLHLKKIGVKTIRAKATSEDHASILRAVGATQIIFPERETAKRVAAQIVNPNLLDFIPLAEGFQVMEIVPPDSFHGRTLQELNLREQKYEVFVIAVEEVVPPGFVFLPGPGFVIKPDDVLIMVGRVEDLARLASQRSEQR